MITRISVVCIDLTKLAQSRLIVKERIITIYVVKRFQGFYPHPSNGEHSKSSSSYCFINCLKSPGFCIWLSH
jgi:hypothetical protein